MKQPRRERIARWLVGKWMPGYHLVKQDPQDAYNQYVSELVDNLKHTSGHVVMTKLNDNDTIGSKTVKEIIAETKVPR